MDTRKVATRLNTRIVQISSYLTVETRSSSIEYLRQDWIGRVGYSYPERILKPARAIRQNKN